MKKEIWVDQRRAEVIDAPYFHVVFTLPHELNPLIYCNHRLYSKNWCPYIKKTFNGFGNAIEYLGRYTHKIAISNSRILSVNDIETTFTARRKKPGDPKRTITLSNAAGLKAL